MNHQKSKSASRVNVRPEVSIACGGIQEVRSCFSIGSPHLKPVCVSAERQLEGPTLAGRSFTPLELSSIENSVAYRGRGRGRRRRGKKSGPLALPSEHCLKAVQITVESNESVKTDKNEKEQSKPEKSPLNKSVESFFDLELEEGQRPDEANTINFCLGNTWNDSSLLNETETSGSEEVKHDTTEADFQHGLLIKSLVAKRAEVTIKKDREEGFICELQSTSDPPSYESENIYKVALERPITPLDKAWDSVSSDDSISTIMDGSKKDIDLSENDEKQSSEDEYSGADNLSEKCDVPQEEIDSDNYISDENDEIAFDAKRTISCATQTEWSWFDDFKAIQEHRKDSRSSKGIKEEKDDRKHSENTSVSQDSRRKSISKDQNKCSSPKEKSNTSSVALSQEGKQRTRKKINRQMSLKSYRIIESLKTAFEQSGQPLDTQSEDESSEGSETTDEDSSSYDSKDSESLLPSVGPPQILQYQRESHHHLAPGSNKAIAKQSGKHLEKSLFSGPCQFCGKQILPLPTLKEVESLPGNQVSVI